MQLQPSLSGPELSPIPTLSMVDSDCSSPESDSYTDTSSGDQWSDEDAGAP